MAKQVTAQAFKRSMSWGRKGIFRSNLCVEQSEEGIVEIIQNLIDLLLKAILLRNCFVRISVLLLASYLTTQKFLRLQAEETDAT